MTQTSYDNLDWASDSVSWPNWIEQQVRPNMPGSYGRGLLPGYSNSDEIASPISSYMMNEDGYPEMLQPPPYSNSYGVEEQPKVSPLNIWDGLMPQKNKKKGWNDVYQPFGFNSETLQGVGNVLSVIGDGLNSASSYKQAKYSNWAKADFYRDISETLRQQAESSYKIAGVNMARLRGNQAAYLAEQKVSGVRTGFAPTSGSIEAVQAATMSKFEQQIWDAEREAEQRRQSTNYMADISSWRSRQARRMAEYARKQQRRSNWGILGGIAGAVTGGIIGGPRGMSIGSKFGSAIGNAF